MSDILIYGQTTARLPSAYQEVEYLQASGTQYIDTGFIPTNDTLEIEYVAQKSSSADAIILGVDNTNITNALNINEYGTTDLYARLRGSSSSAKLTAPTSFYIKHTVKIANTTVYYDDTQIGTITTTTSLSTNTSPLRVFGRTGTTSYLYHGKLYSLIYKENNVKELELVPCYRKSDSVAGLYDLANSVFYTNAGTGTFTVGPDVSAEYLVKTAVKNVVVGGGSTLLDKTITFKEGTETKQIVSVLSGNSVSKPSLGYRVWKDSNDNVITFPYTPAANINLFGYGLLPSAYQEVKYILLNSSSIINTGYVIDSESIKIDFKAKCYNYSTNPFGSSSNNDTNWCNPYFTEYGWDFYIGSSQKLFRGAMSSRDTVYAGTLTVDSTTARLQVTEGSTYDTTVSHSGTIISGNNNPIALGGIILNGTASRMTGGHTWYYFTVTKNDTIVLDLIPCYRKSDNVPGMYDTVSRTFITNYGTGTITVGPDVN